MARDREWNPDGGRAVWRAWATRRRRRRLPLLVLSLLVVWPLWLATLGLPPAWTIRLSRFIFRGKLAVEAESLRLDVVDGLVLKDVRVFRRGIVGPPLVASPSALLRLDPLGPLSGRSWLRAMHIRGATAVRLPFDQSGKQDTEPPDFGFFSLRVALENCELAGQWIERAEFDLSAAGHLLRFEDVTVTVGAAGERRALLTGAGEFRGRTGAFSGRVDMKGDPAALAPIFRVISPGVAEFLQDFHAGDDPVGCEARFEGAAGREWAFRLDGDLYGRRCVYRDVPIKAFHGAARFAFGAADGTVTLDPLVIVRPEGFVAAGFTVDVIDETVEFHGVSRAQPLAVARMIGPFAERIAALFRVEGPVEVNAGGLAAYGDADRTDAWMEVRGERFGYDRLLFDRCQFRADIEGTVCRIRDIRGSALGGTVTGEVDLVMSETAAGATEVRYDTRGGCHSMDFGAVVRTFSNREDDPYEGVLAAEWQVAGLGGEGQGRTAVGEGLIRVESGRLFRIPLFGRFSDMMVRIVPGMDLVLSQGHATVPFTVREGVARSDRIRIEGDVLSLNGHGSYGFDTSMDADVQVRFLREQSVVGRALRVLTFPVSKLLEFRLRGTLADPRWYPVNFSPDLLEKIGLGSRTRPEGEGGG